jgi:hypothetical protein
MPDWIIEVAWNTNTSTNHVIGTIQHKIKQQIFAFCIEKTLPTKNHLSKWNEIQNSIKWL